MALQQLQAAWLILRGCMLAAHSRQPLMPMINRAQVWVS